LFVLCLFDQAAPIDKNLWMVDAPGLEPAVVFENKYRVAGIFRAWPAGEAQRHQVKDTVAIRIANAFSIA
jgi:hypothetical protein